MPWVDGLPTAWRQKPDAVAGFIDMRAELAGARISAGVRAERFSTDAQLPLVPRSMFVPDSLTRDRYVLRAGSEPWQERLELLQDCGGAATAAARTNPSTGQTVCRNNFAAIEDESAISPRIAAEYDLGRRFSARASYASYVQNPRLHLDEVTGGFNTTYAGAYEPVRETAMELGFTSRTVAHSWVDVALFRHVIDNPLATVTRQFSSGGGTMIVRTMGNGDGYTTTGVEISARHVVSSWLGVQGHVTYSRTKLDIESESALAGSDDGLTDPVTAAGILAFEPGKLVANGPAHTVLSDLTLHMTGSWTDGARYTRLQNVGDGTLVGQTGQYIGGGTPAEEFNRSRMPAWKQLDLRIAKGVAIAGGRAALFADMRNPLGIENTRYVFAETGTTTNEIYRARQIEQNLLNQTGTGAIQDMVIDTWPGENDVNRYMLRRAEARFGNGDGIFTVDEMIRAFTAGMDLQTGSQRMFARQRELRLGVELRF